MSNTNNTARDITTSGLSSLLTVVACSPLEVLKINAQVTPSTNSVRGMVVDIYKTHSPRGFYKGLGVSCLAQPSFWMFYWPIYNKLKANAIETHGSFSTQNKMASVFIASLTGSMAVNPLFVFKTRFQTSVLKEPGTGQKITYVGLARDIYQKEGIRGLYKGNFVAQIKNTQMVIQMPLYDYLNSQLQQPFVCGVLAKTIASCVIYYPIDAIRTNIRDTVENKSIVQTIRTIYKRPGGILNFYRGVGIYWLSAVPAFGLLVTLFEKMEKYF